MKIINRQNLSKASFAYDTKDLNKAKEIYKNKRKEK